MTDYTEKLSELKSLILSQVIDDHDIDISEEQEKCLHQKFGTGRTKQAIPHADLVASLMNPCEPKTEREHAAAREIERLRADLAAAKQVIDNIVTSDVDPLKALLREAGQYVHKEYFNYGVASVGDLHWRIHEALGES